MYIRPPTPMKRSVGDQRMPTRRPCSVWYWFTVNAATGMIIIMLCTMDSVTIHCGTGPPIRWWPPTWP